MKTVFVSGSRRISRLNEEIRARLKNMIENQLAIIVGDANGADKAMQSYFFDEGYDNVMVYCSGPHCRNNVGRWQTFNVKVDEALKGREFYTQKDKEMAKSADVGFVLWDGKSNGSITNAMEMLSSGKSVVIYFSPRKQFHTLKSIDQLSELVSRFDGESYDEVFRKNLNGVTRSNRKDAQGSLPIF